MHSEITVVTLRDTIKSDDVLNEITSAGINLL